MPHIVRLDATNEWPFGQEVATHVFSEHMIEHMTYDKGQRFLQQAFKAMVPGGKIRVSCPDLRFLVELWQNEAKGCLTPLQRAYIDRCAGNPKSAEVKRPTACFVLNWFVRMGGENGGHMFIYDVDTLGRALLQAGFTHVVQHRLSMSADPELRDLEIVSRLPEGMLQLESMVLEAEKPLTGPTEGTQDNR